MAINNKFLYPVTKKTFHKYAESIFKPIRRGESVTTVWVPMAGRRMWNKFLIENISLFEKELPEHKRYLLVYIEPLDLTEENLPGYLRLMGKSFIVAAKKNKELKGKVDLKSNYKIFDDDGASYSKLLDALKVLLGEVVEVGFGIVFFLGEFDELDFENKVFFNNLKSLWNRLHPNLHYVLLLRERVTRGKNIENWGEFNEVIMQNILYLPLLKGSDIDYVTNRISDQYSLKLSDKQKTVLKKVCGGHPYLIKASLRTLSNTQNKKMGEREFEHSLINYYELQSVSRGILNVRTNEEQAVLEKVAKEKPINSREEKELLEFMKNLGIVECKGKVCRLFGKLAEETLLNHLDNDNKEHTKDKGFSLDDISGAVLLGGVTVEEKFSRQEYLVLQLFLKNKGKLLTRDNIGDVLWGKESYEDYSDWAIDQLISKLRKKLKDNNTGDEVVTIRGKGYKLVRIGV